MEKSSQPEIYRTPFLFKQNLSLFPPLHTKTKQKEKNRFNKKQLYITMLQYAK